MTDTVNGGHVSGDRLNALLQVLWEKNRSVVLARIATIERAVSELAGGPGNSSSPSNARRSAEWEAHKLAGSLGTFGFHRGTEIAREIELTLAVARDLDSSEVLHMSDLTLQLRGEVEKKKRSGAQLTTTSTHGTLAGERTKSSPAQRALGMAASR